MAGMGVKENESSPVVGEETREGSGLVLVEQSALMEAPVRPNPGHGTSINPFQKVVRAQSPVHLLKAQPSCSSRALVEEASV